VTPNSARGTQKIYLDRHLAPDNPNQEASKARIKQSMRDKMSMIEAKNKKITRDYEVNYNSWRDYDLLTCLITLIGLALAVVDWEFST